MASGAPSFRQVPGSVSVTLNLRYGAISNGVIRRPRKAFPWIAT
jgi:hypothetical protein